MLAKTQLEGQKDGPAVEAGDAVVADGVVHCGAVRQRHMQRLLHIAAVQVLCA